MRGAATLLVSLALLAGLPQMAIFFVALFSSGWAALPLALALLLLPVAPLVLMVFAWRNLPPLVPALAAIVSIAVSGGLVWVFYNTD